MFTQDSDPIADMKIGIEPEIKKWVETTPDYKCALSNTITRDDYLWICINNGRYKKNDDYLRYLIDHNVGVNYKACEFACMCFRDELSKYLIDKLVTMKKLSIGEIAPILPNDINTVRRFIHESAANHLNYGRTLSKVQKDIKTGKLGEIALARMLKRNGFECSEVMLRNKKWGDGGIDLVVNGKNVQVKSTTYHTPERLCIPVTDVKMKADIYVLLQVNENKNFVKFLGAISREEILDKKLLTPVHDNPRYVVRRWSPSSNGHWLATAPTVQGMTHGNIKYYYVERLNLRAFEEVI